MSSETAFPPQTAESAPPAARRALTAIQENFGYLPSAAARMANSPRTLDGFLKLNAMFESTSLAPVEREVLVLAVATRNGCHVCVALHSQRLDGMNADPELIAALRTRKPLDDPRLEALRLFVLHVMDTTGDVGEEELRAFLAHGYTAEQALEVVLGIGTYTLSTFANRMIGAELDAPMADFAWHDA
jgi:uncharacterized peroxidase-related enzyme